MSDLRMDLEEGYAEYMGEGMWLLLQDSSEGLQSVAVTREDLERLLAAD